jgi:hypothetical protein
MNCNEDTYSITLDNHYNFTAIMIFYLIMAQIKGFDMYIEAFVLNIFNTFLFFSKNTILDERYYFIDMIMMCFLMIKMLNITLCMAHVILIKFIYDKVLISIIRLLFIMIQITLLYIFSSLIATDILGLFMIADSFVTILIYLNDITKYCDHGYDLILYNLFDPMYHFTNIMNYILSVYQSYMMNRFIRQITTYSNSMYSSDNFCLICQNTEIYNYVKINICKHIYHDMCLNRWFSSIQSKRLILCCPMCKQCLSNQII